MINIGDCIAYHRKQAKLSRLALAEMAGVGKTAVYDIEHGKQTIQWNTLTKVMTTLNIKLSLESPLMSQYEETKDASR